MDMERVSDVLSSTLALDDFIAAWVASRPLELIGATAKFKESFWELIPINRWPPFEHFIWVT